MCCTVLPRPSFTYLSLSFTRLLVRVRKAIKLLSLVFLVAIVPSSLTNIAYLGIQEWMATKASFRDLLKNYHFFWPQANFSNATKSPQGERWASSICQIALENPSPLSVSLCKSKNLNPNPFSFDLFFSSLLNFLSLRLVEWPPFQYDFSCQYLGMAPLE